MFQYASFFSLLYIYIYIHTSLVLITVIYYRACGSMQLINCYFAPFSPDKINFSDNRHRTSSLLFVHWFFFHFQLTIHSIDAQLSMRWRDNGRLKKTCKRDNFIKTESAIIAWNSMTRFQSSKDDNWVCINSKRLNSPQI